MKLSNNRFALAAPLVVGLLVRLATIPFAPLGEPIIWEYGQIAKHLWLGDGYAYHSYTLPSSQIVTPPTAFMLPGEVYVDYIGFALFGNTVVGHATILVLHALFGVVFIYAIAKIVARLFGNNRITLLAAWLAALYPSSVIATKSFGLLSTVLALNALFFWSLLVLLDKIRSKESPSKAALSTGALSGLLALFRGETWVIVAAIFLAILWIYRHEFRRAVITIAITTVAMLAICSPWIIRNYIVFDRVVLTTSSVGFNFWRGNTYLFNWPEANYSKYITSNGIDRDAEFKVDRDLMNESVHWMSDHPTIAFEHTAMKFAMLWGIDWYDAESLSILYIALYILTLLCAIGGIVAIRHQTVHLNRDALTIFLVWFSAFSLVAVAFIPLPRLQIMLIGIIFPIVVLGADHWWQKITRKPHAKIAAGI